jgi:hypothetical protein
VTLEADVGGIDEGLLDQPRERGRPTIPGTQRRTVTEAMARLVGREHDVSAARQLDREAALRLARVDVAVHREDGWRGRLRRRVRRHVEMSGHLAVLLQRDPYVADVDASRGHDRERCAASTQHQQPSERG